MQQLFYLTDRSPSKIPIDMDGEKQTVSHYKTLSAALVF